MGAWIETLIMQQDVVAYGSHPVWVRGLKLLWVLLRPLLAYVAPRVGAWIETVEYATLGVAIAVSHPVWVRGLKLVTGDIITKEV